VRKGEGVTERGENRGSEGGVLGPRRGLWVVVVGVHHRSWWWAFITVRGGGRSSPFVVVGARLAFSVPFTA